jgi:hypothetical protein
MASVGNSANTTAHDHAVVFMEAIRLKASFDSEWRVCPSLYATHEVNSVRRWRDGRLRALIHDSATTVALFDDHSSDDC